MGQRHRTAMIHPKAHVDATCFIGANVRVWQFASVTGKAVLGSGTSVSPFAMLHGPDIGPDCIISGGVMAGPGFKLGRGVFVGPNAVLCNDAWPRAHKDGYRADLLAAGHYCVIVEDGASIGANAVVLPGVRIGAGAMIAAGEAVTGDVPAGHLYRGGVSRKFHREPERMRWAV